MPSNKRAGVSPGPWTAEGYDIIDATRELIGTAWATRNPRSSSRLVGPRGRRNARVMAAAFELIEAAVLVDLMFRRMNEDSMGDDEHEAWSAVRAALAKAGVAV